MPFAALAEEAQATSSLQKISEFLTNKEIDPVFSARAGSALSKMNPAFPKAIAALADFIERNGLSDVEELKDAPGFEGDIKTAAQELISALYIGYVGEPKPQSSEDNVEFVAFTEALTYRLTHKYTPIPSYSRWRTNYWEHLPGDI